MDILILAVVIIGILFVIASGVWVAIALVGAISANRDQANKKKQSRSAIRHLDDKIRG